MENSLSPAECFVDKFSKDKQVAGKQLDKLLMQFEDRYIHTFIILVLENVIVCRYTIFLIMYSLVARLATCTHS